LLDAMASDRGCCIVRGIGRSVKDGAMRAVPPKTGRG
jgi:hypothetical protein